MGPSTCEQKGTSPYIPLSKPPHPPTPPVACTEMNSTFNGPFNDVLNLKKVCQHCYVACFKTLFWSCHKPLAPVDR